LPLLPIFWAVAAFACRQAIAPSVPASSNY
jgi:hypothetical protein